MKPKWTWFIFNKMIFTLLEIRHKDLFYDTVRKTIEENGLAIAIHDGRQNDFVTEAEINAILED